MSSLRPHNILGGFTILEMLVVLALIGILATVATLNFSSTTAASRDTQRQADLKNLQNAIEAYRSENGRYPAGCVVGAGANGWSGQLGTIYQCTGGATDGTGQYIVGLAPKYISVLPTDPRLNGTGSGYIYRTNTEGTVYKLKAHRTVESEVVTYEHPLKACDIRIEPNASGNPKITGADSYNPSKIGWCGRLYDGFSYPTPSTCNSLQEAYNKSYAVWGGLAPLITSGIPGLNVYAADPLGTITGATEQVKFQNVLRSIQFTGDVICQ